MSFNGSGSFLINTAGQPVVSGTVISSTAFNALTADLATGLSTCITKDGQTTVTANIPMANYKFTGLGAGSGAADSANLSQVQSTVVKLLASVSGTDTITAVGSPTVAAYAAGQMFYFVAAGDNTGAVTINIDSLGAKAVTRDGSVALAAGDIKSGEVVVIVYDGTRFQVVSQLNSSGDARFANVSIASALNVGGVATVTGGSVLNGGVVINEPGADVDFRIESDTEANAFFLDGTNGNVGIGGTATANNRLLVKGTHVGGHGIFAIQTETTGPALASFYDSSGTRIGFVGSNPSGVYEVVNTQNTAMTFGTNGTERLRLDAAGNLGLGVTPNTWSAGRTAMQIGARGGLNYDSGGGAFAITNNVYYDGADKYIASAAATLHYTAGGAYYWLQAASGTAGNTITFGDAKMVLDASGNLGVGTSSPSGKLNISDGDVRLTQTVGGDAAGVNSYSLYFKTPSGDLAQLFSTSEGGGGPGGYGGSFKVFVKANNGSLTERLKITNTGTFVIPQTYNDTTANAANMEIDSVGVVRRSTSSLRYKTDVKNATYGLAEVLALRPVTYKGINDGDKIFGGLIAEEVHDAGLTEFVVYDKDGQPDALAYGNMVSVLVKAIQELKAELDATKAEVAALKGA